MVRYPGQSKTRPKSITLVAWVFILAGIGGLASDLWPLLTSGAAEQVAKLKADGAVDLTLAWGTRALAIVGGVSLFRGYNWARWLCVAWMLLHVVLSLFHSLGETAAHCAIFAPLTWLLFRKSSSSFFQPL